MLPTVQQRTNERTEDSALLELTETASGELERGIDPRLHRMTFWDSNAVTLRRLADNGRALRVGSTYRLSDSAIDELKRSMAAGRITRYPRRSGRRAPETPLPPPRLPAVAPAPDSGEP
ncbi:MAG: hypothetical protein OES32_02885 [Acidobacteriota bacterium]|nr:hypothetical protein [Acidobacteriota bacterium]MDH3522508.1 hypothetical protein [Acidobacteriota bacterium]